MQTSTEMSHENENIACFASDFQQNLPLPHIPTNDIFCLRQLWVYVFGIGIGSGGGGSGVLAHPLKFR